MSRETLERLKKYCNPYGDKLIELMDRCGAMSLREVTEEKAEEYLKELERGGSCNGS